MNRRLLGLDGGPATGGGERALVVAVTVVVCDRGSEPASHDRAEGPWRRYEAELAGYAPARELGVSPWEAVHGLVSKHRGLLERRWSAWT